MHGREAIRAWIKPIMAQYRELYTAYEWHIGRPRPGRVMVYMQNRRDHPCGTGTIDFPGITILAVRGRRPLEPGGRLLGRAEAYETVESYAAACKELDPEHRKKRTRRHWGTVPPGRAAASSWAERPSVR